MNNELDYIVNESSIRQRKKQILNLGLEELKAICPDLKATTVKLEHIRPRAFDEEITLQTNRTTFRYLLEVKSNVRPETISHMIVLKNSGPKARKTPLLLMAYYINPNIAERLKKAGINYIDTVGNLFLKAEAQLYLPIEGKKPVQPPSGIKIRLFQPSGITLLFGLLIDPQTVNNPYRQLAKENGVALGTVG